MHGSRKPLRKTTGTAPKCSSSFGFVNDAVSHDVKNSELEVITLNPKPLNPKPLNSKPYDRKPEPSILQPDVRSFPAPCMAGLPPKQPRLKHKKRPQTRREARLKSDWTEGIGFGPDASVFTVEAGFAL